METSQTKFDKLFWFLKKGEGGLDFQKDQHLIIHQTLALGSMEDVREIFHKYGRNVVRQEFQKPVQGLYAPSVFHFFQYLLGARIKNKQQYIKNIYGKTSPRNS